jgi:hypothetical protein
MGQQHHQVRDMEYEYGVFLRMHVSVPKVPKCICFAMHAQKATFILVHKVVSKTKEIKFMTEKSIGSWIGTNFLNEFLRFTTELWFDHN